MTCRVLHVVRRMDAGGIAVWLMHLLRHVDRTRYHMDFLAVADGDTPAHGDELRGLGSRIIPCPGYRRPWRFARNFAEVLREHGPYDVVHSHIYNYSGLVLRLARRHGVPVRIAHSHTDTRLEEAAQAWPKRLLRRPYLNLTKRWIHQNATWRIGVSRLAAEALFGPDWQRDPRTCVIPLGLDFGAFGAAYDRAQTRRALGLPEDALVIGHVGNHVWHKNHPFLIDVAREVVAREPRARVLLIGHNLIGSAIEARVLAENLTGRVLILGPRDDVPRLMIGAMDLFLFPAHYEGLGLVLLEAQAAGLPVVLSTGVAEEAAVVPPLLRRLSLEAPAAEWARIVLETANAPRPVAPADAYAQVMASGFNIDTSVRNLMRFYATPPVTGAAGTDDRDPAVQWS